MWLSPIWVYCFVQIFIIIVETAISPPPWGDPKKNPCAKLPGGWQLIYWSPLKQCFKIFQLGFPCPETMELSPAGDGMAECRCPPGTAQNPKTSTCHKLFERGPCEMEEYFAPLPDTLRRSSIPKQRWGICKAPEKCPNEMIFWPKDSKCYTLHAKGPCPKGLLLTTGDDKIATCKCQNKGELAQYYYSTDDTCHEHFSKGPCQGTGDLFLPGGHCGCHAKLPHYHADTNQCFEIGSIGPCPMGHVFITTDDNDNNMRTTMSASCQCKEGYVLWKDGYCYRPYTKGPCDDGEFMINATNCIKNPCRKGRLYFPNEKTCYLIGSQGPCTIQQVVVFDFTTRPSIDGISYNGVCGCSGIITNLDQSCNDRDPLDTACSSAPGMVEVNGQCHKLYSRGPCGPGEWLELRKTLQKIRTARCVCKPGHTLHLSENGINSCHGPSVGIARWLLQLLGYSNTNDLNIN